MQYYFTNFHECEIVKMVLFYFKWEKLKNLNDLDKASEVNVLVFMLIMVSSAPVYKAKHIYVHM